MNQFKRNIKNNQLDCFKPWQTHRNKSNSLLRNSKRPEDMYYTAFANNCNQGRRKSPNTNDPLHAIFVSHLRQQLPNYPQFNTMFKQRKDNKNLHIKEIYNSNIDRTFVEKEIKHPKLRHNRHSNRRNTVYFKDSNSSNRLYSSSETDISSNLHSTACIKQSVRNVIDKFNRLSSSTQNDVASKQNLQKVKKDYISIKPKNDQRKENIISIKIDTEKRNENNQTYENKETSPVHSPQKRESGIQLRSQRVKFINNNAYCDDLLEIFKPKNEEKDTTEKVSLIPRKSVVKFQELESVNNVKELVSSQTQTTPCPSATNIMINVYNHKSPRLAQERSMCLNPIGIKISQDKQENTKLTILQEEICEKEIDITKKSVKSCIEKFEENLRKNGLETEKKISTTKIFSKIRSNYLLKKEYETVLSPRAKSVPF